MCPLRYVPETPKVLEQDLAGKTAVVTGATRGIGRAIALNLACRGCSLLGTYSSKESAHLFDTLEHTIADLYKQAGAPKPKLVGIAANILDDSCSDTIVAALKDFFEAKVNIVVNNAAILVRAPLGQIEVEQVATTLLGNVQTPMMLVNAIVKEKMLQPASRIVNISSDRARDSNCRPGSSLFAASKAALEAMTRVWADELGRTGDSLGTTVNSVCVGLTNTSTVRAMPPELQKALAEERLPLVSVGARLGESEDVADVVGLLVSERARWISGSVVAANGGSAKIF